MVTERDVDEWRIGLHALMDRARPCFRSEQSHLQARLYVEGLLSSVERKNGWSLAQQAGDQGPQKMQRLLNEYAWDEHALRDVIRTVVLEKFSEPDGVLVFDESGFIKKGKKSTGVKRQYTGTAGRVENSQVGVFAVYASSKGRAFIDRELYLPKEWIESQEHREKAGIPKETSFSTKGDLAVKMTRRFVAEYPTLRWATGDEVYGACATLREEFEKHDVGYVLAVAVNTEVSTTAGKIRVDELAEMVPEDAWETYSCADGSKGQRLYDWALIGTTDVVERSGRTHDVLIRRSRNEKKELAFYLTYSPKPATLAELVTVAGRRWPIEECFQAGKNEVGLDHYQVRLHLAWYRHITLSMLAHAWLAVIAREMWEKNPPPHPPKRTATGYQRDDDDRIEIDEPIKPNKGEMIPLTLNEIRHIVSTIWRVCCTPSTVFRWSVWRRRHQAMARYYHRLGQYRAVRTCATPGATTYGSLLL